MKTNFLKRLAPLCAGAMALVASALTGCDGGVEEPTGLGVQHVEAEGVIAVTGGEFTFTVHPGSMDNWTLTFLDGEGRAFETLDWVSLSKASGSGRADVTATVAANTTRLQREAQIIVNAGDRKIPIPVVQAAPYFRVTPSSLTGLPWSEGGANVNRTLTVESNITWYAELTRRDTPVWVQFTGSTDKYGGPYGAVIDGDARVGLDVDNWLEYVTTPPRTASVTFYDGRNGEVLATVPVGQNPRPWLRIDRQPKLVNPFLPDLIRFEDVHDLTTEATLFNSEEPITYTWYAYKAYGGATKDDAIRIPANLASNDGKTITISGEWITDNIGDGAYFYCVASSPGAESVVSENVVVWVARRIE